GRQLDGVRRERMLVIGHSEGGIVAARLAVRFNGITHVALFGSSGPTQLFDLLENERDAAFVERLRDIHRHPNSCSRFAWGHPYRRWSSFLTTSVMEEAIRSRAKFRLVHGVSDVVVPVMAPKMLRAELLRRGRDVTLDLHAGAGHGLATATVN